MKKTFLPILIVIVIIAIVTVPFTSARKYDTEAELENCILEHRENDPACRVLIFKYKNRCK